jgi:ankyrin repeat protein
MSENDQNLVVAAQEGRIEDVRKYIEAGANIEYQDDQGINALIAATQEGHAAIVKLLLERGADINKPNADRQTPLLLAVSLRHPIGLIQILLKANMNPLPSEAGETPMSCAIDRAILYGHFDILRTIIGAGAKVNKKTLMYAIEKETSRGEENRKRVVNMILEEGVKPNQKIIDKANELGHIEMLGQKSSGSKSSGSKSSGSKSSGSKSSGSKSSGSKSSGSKTKRKKSKK